jgi:hypothetical protein
MLTWASLKTVTLRFALLVCGCQVGPTDVPLGFHVVSSGGAGGATTGGAGGAGGLDASCTLVGSQGEVRYTSGETARLEGTLLLSSAHSGKCAQNRDCSLGPEVVEQLSCDASRCQLWQALEMEPGWFVLTNLQNGGCLDVGNGSMAERATIQAFECHARSNQQWQAVCAGGDAWRLVNRNSGLLLGADGAADRDGVLQYADSPSEPQLWRLTQQPEAYLAIAPTSEQLGQTWSHTTDVPADGWQGPMFDSSAWQQGLAAFGTRYEAPWAPRTSWDTDQLWLRRDFLLSSVPSELDVRLFNNGPVEVYINGVLAYQGGASVGYRVAPVLAEALGSLITGENNLAVHCASSVDQSFGPYFDLGLGRLQWR